MRSAAAPAVESVSMVLEHPPLPPAEALAAATASLRCFADSADLAADLASGVEGVLVLDARRPEAYARGHIPGAVNLPHREISAESAARLPAARVIVTYCDGIGCNGSTKAALRLAALGYTVKELIGGLDGWIRDGLAVARDTADSPPASASVPTPTADSAAARCAC
jgi:rhodanese-related sulfurtransferase